MSTPEPSIGRAAGTVSTATFFSRIFGLIRDQIFAALMGAGFFSDAYVIAFRIPNMLRDLFAENALSSAFVPTFTEYKERRSPADAWALANLVIGSLLVIVGVLTLIGIFFAPDVVRLIAPGFGGIEGKRELTIFLTRLMFPFLPLVALAALFMGMLNVHREFAIPAFAPVMFNLVSIAFGLALWFLGVDPRTAVIGWSVGTLCGGVAQAGTQLPRLLKLGWKPKPTLSGWKESAGLHQIGALMVPAIIANSGLQVNVLVNSILASLLEQGSPSWLNYAFRLMQLPLGVFGVAISVVTLQVVSKDAANESMDRFRSNLSSSLSLVFILTIPCAVGLWLLGVPIIRLIYEHGAFTSADTLATTSALAMYAVGLPAYSAVKVMAPTFFALKHSRAPMIASLTGIAVNLAFNLLFFRKLGHAGLALGTSLGMYANLILLTLQLHTKNVGVAYGDVGSKLLRIVVASGVLAVSAHYSFAFLTGRLPGMAGHLLETLVPIAISALLYFGVLAGLGVSEVKRLIHKPKV